MSHDVTSAGRRGVAGWLLSLPRLARIGLVALFALATTLVLSPIVDQIYLQFLYSPQTVVSPALVSAAFGLATYALGWWLLVSGADDDAPMTMLIVWYAFIGAVVVMLAVVLLLVGIVTGATGS